MKTSQIRTAKRKTWQAVSRFIRTRDPLCVTCLMAGKQTPSTEAGHYKHTSDKGNAQLGGNEVWYDARNLNGQCGTCNRWNSGELDLYGLYLEKTYGFGICQELNKLYNTPKKWTLEMLADVRAAYERRTAILQRNRSTNEIEHEILLDILQ